MVDSAAEALAAVGERLKDEDAGQHRTEAVLAEFAGLAVEFLQGNRQMGSSHSIAVALVEPAEDKYSDDHLSGWHKRMRRVPGGYHR